MEKKWKYLETNSLLKNQWVREDVKEESKYSWKQIIIRIEATIIKIKVHGFLNVHQKGKKDPQKRFDCTT